MKMRYTQIAMVLATVIGCTGWSTGMSQAAMCKYQQTARNALSRLKIPSGDDLMFTSGLNVGNGQNGSPYITITMPNGPKVEQVEDTMLSIWGTEPTAPMDVSVNVQYLPLVC